MKSIVTESPATPVQSGPRLMRDKRDGQVVLVTDASVIALTEVPVTGYAVGSVRPIRVCGDYPVNQLEPFNGSVTLSND